MEVRDTRARQLTEGRTGALIGLVAGLLMLGPALAPGFLLRYDLVFVPSLAFSPRTLGTDGFVPRAVPNDAVVALLSAVLPGDWVQKLLLVGVFVVVGAGVGRLMPSRLAAGAAALAASWNPWVLERLGIGHWGFLIGYALVPWAAWAAQRLSARWHSAGLPSTALPSTGLPSTGPSLNRAAALPLGVVLLAGALGGSTSGVLVTLTAVITLACARGPRVERLAHSLGAALFAVGANAAWWWPYLSTSSRSADPAGVSAFAAAPDTPLGVIGSLALGGGIWNDRQWPTERGSLLVAGIALLISAAVMIIAGNARAWSGGNAGARRGLLISGVLGLLVAGFTALPGGLSVTTWVVTQVPGGGLIRDGQKFTAAWVITIALASGWSIHWLRSAVSWWPVSVWLALAAWPALLLPSALWGHSGQWQSTEYPSSVIAVARYLNEEARPGAVAVLPWGRYRSYPWNGDRVMLDPWERLVTRRVVQDDALPLRTQIIAGEDPLAATVAAAMRPDAAGRVRADNSQWWREHGIRYLLVQTDQPPGTIAFTPPRARVVAMEPGLRLLDVGPVAHVERPQRPWGLVVTGVSATLLALCWVFWRRQ